MVAADPRRRVDAVHRAGQLDVHQDQVRAQLGGQLDRILAALGVGDRLVAQAGQLELQITRDDGLVLDDEDARPRGGFDHGAMEPGKGAVSWVAS